MFVSKKTAQNRRDVPAKIAKIMNKIMFICRICVYIMYMCRWLMLHT